MSVDPFSYLDFTLDEAIKANENLKPKVKDHRVCLCGHGVARHRMGPSGAVVCKPGKMNCACQSIRPVLDVSDLRVFLRKTDGYGPKHALSRGMASAVAKGIEMTWLIEPSCDRCQGTPVVPAAVSTSLEPVEFDSGHSVFLCRSCLSSPRV